MEIMSLESTKDLLFGNMNHVKESAEMKLSVSLEGFEDILLDSNDDPSFFAMESAKSFGEAASIATLLEISQEAEGGDKTKFGANAIAAVKAFFAKLLQSIANFIKQIQVWISGASMKSQLQFYEKIKGDAGKIEKSDATFKGIVLKNAPDKFVNAVVSGSKPIGILAKVGLAVGGEDAEYKQLVFGSPLMSNYPKDKPVSAVPVLRTFLYGTPERTTVDMKVSEFFAGSAKLDILGASFAASMKAIVDLGKKTAADIKQAMKESEALAKAGEANPQSAKIVSRNKTIAMMKTQLALSAFQELMFIRGVVMSAAKAGLKA